MKKRRRGSLFIGSVLNILALGLILTATQDTVQMKSAKKHFRVTSVRVSVDPASFTGSCPKTFTFTARIIANQRGTVRYRWLRSDGAQSSIKTLTYHGMGSRTVTSTWSLGGYEKTYTNYWKKIKIISPNSMVSKPALFTLRCRRPLRAPSYSISGTVTGGADGRLIRKRKVKVLLKIGSLAGRTYMSRILTINASGNATYTFSGPALRPGTYALKVEKVASNPDTLTDQLNVCFNGTNPASRTVVVSNSQQHIRNQDFTILFHIAWDRSLCW